MVTPLRWVPEPWCTVTLQSHNLTGLSARGDLDRYLAVDDWSLDRISKDGVQVANGLFGINLGTFSTEIIVLLDTEEDVQVSSWATVRAGITLTSDTQLVTVLNTGGDRDLDLFRLLVESLTATRSTVLFDLLPSSSARRAGLLGLEVTKWCPCHLDCYTATSTGRTGRDFGTGFHTTTLTGVTCFEVTDPDLLLSTEDSCLEVNVKVESEVVTDDGTTLGTASTATHATTETSTHTTAHSSATEERIEDIIQVDLLAESSTSTTERRSWTGITGS
mmetsp:Transcript_17681/g.43088  ORF Transcript_17681/g.43088 Transcript_17681/m.43088 type:complete len:276 (-) Transcript_17681:539-1366(-)